MKRKTLLYLYTFLGVGFVVFIVGFTGINISLRYIENKYVNLQLDVNKRQAQSTARLLESELANGMPMDTVQKRFQQTIQGTEFDRGFLCMFDTQKEKLVCHPDAKMVGLMIPADFTFDIDNRKNVAAAVEMKTPGPIAGIFTQGKMRTDIAYLERVKGTPWRIAAHQNINLMRNELAMIRRNYIWGSLILGLILAFAATFIARRIGQSYEHQIEEKNRELAESYAKLKELHEEVNAQKEEIEAQRDTVTFQRDQIAKQNKDIVDSINYARQIQLALLPSAQLLKEQVPSHFVFFHPKDIVSGDFYWCKTVDQTTYFAVADCTGHGVPGAFMSLLGITLLNEIVGQACHCSPAEVLNELRTRVKLALRQNEREVTARDGMDIALVTIKEGAEELQYAGAYNSLVVIRNGEILEVKADRMPIGIHPREEASFTNHTVALAQSDTIYLYSDGFADQTGGDNGRKYMSKNLKQLLASIATKPIEQQHALLNDALSRWMGSYAQVDDITVVGFRR